MQSVLELTQQIIHKTRAVRSIRGTINGIILFFNISAFFLVIFDFDLYPSVQVLFIVTISYMILLTLFKFTNRELSFTAFTFRTVTTSHMTSIISSDQGNRLRQKIATFARSERTSFREDERERNEL